MGFNLSQSGLRVCVDEAGNGHVAGRALSRLFSAPLEFGDLGSLVLRADEIFDALNFPQAYQRARSFAPRAAAELPAATQDDALSAEAVDAARGARATLLVHILSRRSSSWQGEVDWLDGSPRERFSSALELIRMIDEHLGAQ